MKKRGMKVSSMRVAISADTELLLLTDEKFSNTAGTLGAELIREGVIGKVAGVPTKPNYLMGDDVEFIIYDKRFCQKYEVWKKEPSVEDIKDGKHIGSSALQGRQVGGLMVTNALGVQIKKNTAEEDEDETTDEATYVATSDTKYLADKTYYSKEGDVYTALVAGTDYTVGDDIAGTVYEVSE